MERVKLAIDGHEPVRKKPFPPWPYFWEEEKKAVREVLDSGKVNYWTGPKGREFEKKFAEYLGINHAVAVNSGTSALHAALAAANIGAGDEVIVPPLTFIATATCVIQQLAIPVFADVEWETHNIDPQAVRRAITERTKAIIPVHLSGHPAEMDEIMEIAEENNLVVIEDCAQAHGAEYKGRKIGTFGHINAFSFCQDKIFTTGGEGGMVVTNDDKYDKIVREFCLHSGAGGRLGFNYRMTEMQSAIGLVALKKLDRFVEKRRKNARYLTKHLASIQGIHPPVERPHVKHSYYRYVCTLDLDKLKVTKDEFIKAVAAEGVPIQPHATSELYMNPTFQKQLGYGRSQCPFKCPLYKGRLNYQENLCPKAQRIGRETFRLRVHPTIEEEDLDDVMSAINRVFKAYRNS